MSVASEDQKKVQANSTVQAEVNKTPRRRITDKELKVTTGGGCGWVDPLIRRNRSLP